MKKSEKVIVRSCMERRVRLNLSPIRLKALTIKDQGGEIMVLELKGIRTDLHYQT